MCVDAAGIDVRTAETKAGSDTAAFRRGPVDRPDVRGHAAGPQVNARIAVTNRKITKDWGRQMVPLKEHEQG